MIAGDLVIAGSDDRDPGGRGFVYAWETATGRVRWKREAGRGVMADPVLHGSSVYVVTLSDELLCLALDSGDVRWAHAGAGPPPASESVSVQTTPLVSGGRVFRGTQDGRLVALDAQHGRTMWTTDLGAPAIGPVTQANGTLYVATRDAIVAARAKDGTVVARTRTGTRPSGPVLALGDARFVFVVDRPEPEDEAPLALRSYTADLGSVRWARSTRGGWTSSRPYVWKDELLLGGRGRLAGIRPTDGSESWTDTVSGTVRGLAAADGRLYVGTLGGALHAYEPPAPTAAPAASRPPNIVLVVADDLGWGDLGSYGHPTVKTPHIDRLAAEGQRWTSFYSGAPYCTASRAGLLTGRLPVRSGMASEARTVLFPDSVGGLPPAEVTIPELLKSRGYATAMMGKWHLGHRPEHQPENHGFDLYFGIPYSNDMDAILPDGPEKNALIRKPKNEYFDVPVFSGGKVVERPAQQETLTLRYVQRAEAFIRANRERPFFLYLAHHLPHVPLFVHDPKEGHGPHATYPDVMEEIDEGVGRLRAVVAELGLEKDTLFVFTSDNGPWLAQKDIAGSSGPFRDGKGTTFEGGVRVPALFLWPGTVKPGVVGDMGAFFDLLPTFAALAGAEVPRDRVLDGHDLTAVLRGTGRSPRTEYFYYRGSTLQAVRSGPHKAHFVTRAEGWDQSPRPIDPPWLYDLEADPAERYDLAAERPDVVAKLRKQAEEHTRGVQPVEDQIAKGFDGSQESKVKSRE